MLALSATYVGETSQDQQPLSNILQSYPSPLNYCHFPKSVCTSVNEVICHGIPDQRPLQDGDILNIDVTLYHGGFHGDLNETYPVGRIDDDSKKLLKVTRHSLDEAIKICKPGALLRDIGKTMCASRPPLVSVDYKPTLTGAIENL